MLEEGGGGERLGGRNGGGGGGGERYCNMMQPRISPLSYRLHGNYDRVSHRSL